MRSFSSGSYDNDHHAALQQAMERAKGDPEGLLTDGQWFLLSARDVVFYNTYSRVGYTKAELKTIVANMVELAPSLTWAYQGARPNQPLTDGELDYITRIVEVDNFDGLPDSTMGKGDDVFDRPDMPLLRVTAYVLKGGVDAQGRGSLVNIRASHALLEGSDSALLTRSQSAAHGVMTNAADEDGVLKRVVDSTFGWMIAGLMTVLGNTLSPKQEQPWYFRTLVLDRHRVRALANRLGVRQRALYFALIVHGLNGTGEQRVFGNRPVKTLYTLLESEANRTTRDSFMRVSARRAKFDPIDDFVEFVRMADQRTAGAETPSDGKPPSVIGAAMGKLRKLSKIAPSLYGPRFWRLGFGIDLGLTMVPPHFATGGLTRDAVEPIYCGAYHPMANVASFCPGRRYMTVSFCLDGRLAPNVDRIMTLLEATERRQIAPVAKAAPQEVSA